MSLIPADSPARPIEYPDSDGERMAENLLQLEWIVRLYSNLAAVYAREPNVLVGGDLLWYAVEGDPKARLAPDTFVVFGRPKGYRGSYKSWEEDDVPMTVTMEVLSPSNTVLEMSNKRLFYEEHGVEEYYVIDPDNLGLEIYLRQGSVFRRQWQIDKYVSPRLGIRFELTTTELRVYGRDGRLFHRPEEMEEERRKLLALATELEQRAGNATLRADNEKTRADNEKTRADNEKTRADNEKTRADNEKTRADAAIQRAKRIAELSRKARHQQATAEELTELDRLEAEEASS